MPFSQMDLMLGVGVPVLVAAVMSLLIRMIPWPDAYRRQAAGFALGGAFFLGCRLIELSDWLPTQPWMWFPYAVLAGALCGPMSAAPGVSWLERFVLFAVLSMIAAWMLVPTWSSLEPERWIWWIGTAASMTVVGLCIEFLAAKDAGSRLPLMLFIVMTITSILVMLSGSARFAQFMMAIAGGLFGLALVGWIKPQPGTTAGVGCASSIALVGMLMTARVNSFTEIPFASYMVLAAIPVTLMLTSIPAVAKGKAWKSWGLSSLIVLVGCAISVGLAIAYDPSIIKVE